MIDEQLDKLVTVSVGERSISVLIEESDGAWAIIWYVNSIDDTHIYAANRFAARVRAAIARFIESQK